jgi:hypothetical protein
MNPKPTIQNYKLLIRNLRTRQEDILQSLGLRVEQKFNYSGYFEYHILNYANQTISKNTVLQFAIDSAVQLFK